MQPIQRDRPGHNRLTEPEAASAQFGDRQGSLRTRNPLLSARRVIARPVRQPARGAGSSLFQVGELARTSPAMR